MQTNILSNLLTYSQVGDAFATEWTAILAFANPLLNTLCMEYVLLVAVEGCHEVISIKVIPTDGALSPQARLTLIEVAFFLFVLRLFYFEPCLVQ